MAGESKYSTPRGLFIFLCLALIIIAAVRSVKSLSGSTSHLPPAVKNELILTTNYQRRFCENRKTIDYSGKNPEKITIALREGCYGDRVVLPLAWQAFEPSLSSRPGDYMSVWCDEEANPRQIVPYTGDANKAMDNCPAGRPSAKFSPEGRGTLTLVRTKTSTAFITAHEELPSEQPHKTDPILPTSGADPDFPFVINECHRSDERILCTGMVTNRTDARTHVQLKDSSAVDDEGNSIFIGIFGGGFSFVGTGSDQRLMPNVPTKFQLTINDPHRNVKNINLQILTDWTSEGRYDTLIFQGVPVQ